MRFKHFKFSITNLTFAITIITNCQLQKSKKYERYSTWFYWKIMINTAWRGELQVTKSWPTISHLGLMWCKYPYSLTHGDHQQHAGHVHQEHGGHALQEHAVHAFITFKSLFAMRSPALCWITWLRNSYFAAGPVIRCRIEEYHFLTYKVARHCRAPQFLRNSMLLAQIPSVGKWRQFLHLWKWRQLPRASCSAGCSF